MIRRGCFSPETIARLVRGELQDEEVEATSIHLRNCSRCQERVALLRRIVRAGAEEVHGMLGDVAILTAALLAEPEHRWPLLAREAPYCRFDVARRLLVLAVNERERSLRRAAQMALAAAKIADDLVSESADVVDLQFEAWKTHSFLLRERGRYDDCLAALARAEEAADRVSEPELARASIWHSRALILAEPDVWEPEEALKFLDRAEAVYAERDPGRSLHLRTTRGIVLCRAGQLHRAYELFAEVHAKTDPRDEFAYADAQAALVDVLFELGDIARAEELHALVHEIDLRHDRTVNLARDLLVQARIARTRGDECAADDAIEAMKRFHELGMGDEAVRSGLSAVYSLVANEKHDSALSLCRRLVADATALDLREPKRRRTLTATAISYLSELARRHALTLDVIAEVERYVARIAVQPCVPFRPPVPLEPM